MDALMLVAVAVLMVLSALTPVFFYAMFGESRQSSLSRIAADFGKDVEHKR